LLQDRLEITPGLRKRLRSLRLALLVEYLEDVARRQPSNLDVLAELGQVYTDLGRHADGLRVDRILAGLVPENPTVHYNLACSLALVGGKAEALDALERAVRLGYADGAHMARDRDLAVLRSEPRFQELLRRLESEEAPT
jgi:Flp pilus assembly protein TadD